ncbi:MAG: rhamnogalacturonan acetylesterase [Verrucomicrobiota bacterium]
MLRLACLLPLLALGADPVAEFRGSAAQVSTVVSQPAAEGMVVVTVEFGATDVDSVTTVKAETRRLLALNVAVPKGQTVTRRFLVDVRRPEYTGGRVTLKARETSNSTWDQQLSLEFLGPTARAKVVSVAPAPNSTVRIFLAGDSTMTDQANEPYVGWGQAFPLFIGERAVVANHAESGRALRSFQGEHRLDKILSQLRKDDFVLIQFGHNDQKEKGEGVGAFTTYAKRLRDYLDAIQAKGGKPVLVTAVARRRFDDKGQVTESLGDFPEAVRRVAKERSVPLIDLNTSSKQVYQALGVEKSKLALLHFPAKTFPGQTDPLRDDTHFSAYGAYEMARCVIEGIRQGVPELAAFLAPSVQPFDPSHPDDPAQVAILASPFIKGDQPEGK